MGLSTVFVVRAAALLLATLAAAATPARAVAHEGDDTLAEPGPAPLNWRESTVRATAEGAFLPLTMAASLPTQAAQVATAGGYDGARAAAIMESHTEVRLWGPLSVRAGVRLGDNATTARPSVGARLQLLSQQRHGIDGTVGVFYRAEGLTEPEGEIETVVALGVRRGAAAGLLNLAYGQDPEGRERDGEVRAAALWLPSPRLNLGIDTRWRFDLGSSRGSLAAMREPTYDADAGPVIAVVVGPVALSAHAGASVLGRVGMPTRVGLIALGGVGTAF